MQNRKISGKNSTEHFTKRVHYSTKRLMNRITYKIILRNDQIRSDGTCAISIQVFINKKKTVLALNQYCRPDQWDKENRRMYSWHQNADVINMTIDSAIGKCIDIKTRYFLRDKPITRDAFVNEFTRPEMRLNFIGWMHNKIETEWKYKRAEGTVRHYRNTLKLLQTIKGDFHFANINYQFVMDFENWMNKHNYHINNKWKQHKNFRAFINEAIKCDIYIENPYKKFKIRSIDGRRVWLTPDEGKKLADLYEKQCLPPSMQEELRRFLFTCYTGLRYSDSIAVTHDQIEDDTLTFIPKKTASLGLIVSVPLNNNAKKYLTGNSGPLFKVMTQKTSQLHLKDIARLAGIKKRITTHVGRHSFAAWFLNAGGTVHTLQKLLGHRKLETTCTYLHVVDTSKRKQILMMDN